MKVSNYYHTSSRQTIGFGQSGLDFKPVAWKGYLSSCTDLE